MISCWRENQRTGQLIDYGYIQDVEVDSDDEDDDGDVEGGEGVAENDERGVAPGDGDTTGPSDPSSGVEGGQQERVAPPPEGGEASGEGVMESGEPAEPAEPPSPMAQGVAGLALAVGEGKAGDGNPPPRFEAPRMFMDVVRLSVGVWGGRG